MPKKKVRRKVRRVTASEHGKVNIDGKHYRPIVGIVASKWDDGTPKRVVIMRDDDEVSLDGGEEFVVFLGSTNVFGEAPEKTSEGGEDG